MTDTVRPVSAAAISTLLKKAGLNRSDPADRSGRTTGFAVSKNHVSEGTVRVRHVFWSMGSTAEQHAPYLNKYAKAIEDAGGYDVTWDGDQRCLVVSRKEGE